MPPSSASPSWLKMGRFPSHYRIFNSSCTQGSPDPSQPTFLGVLQVTAPLPMEAVGMTGHHSSPHFYFFLVLSHVFGYSRTLTALWAYLGILKSCHPPSRDPFPQLTTALSQAFFPSYFQQPLFHLTGEISSFSPHLLCYLHFSFRLQSKLITKN